MKFYIVIPTYNEEKHLRASLNSLVNQTHLPKKLVIVNDNSSDASESIIKEFSEKYSWITLVNNTSKSEHIPGSKVIEAFYKGFETLDEDYDVICKFDADIIFPENYLEEVSKLFKSDNTIGIAGGLPFIKKNDEWIFETVASKNHVRGPIKAYRKECFKAINGLKKSIGWDTVDVLLAQFHSWKTATIKDLHVKHLKPTGNTYTPKSKYLQGEALYKMRFGFCLSFLSALKSSYNKKSLKFLVNTIKGYFKSKGKNLDFIVTKEEGKFIRKTRWKGVLKKIF